LSTDIKIFKKHEKPTGERIKTLDTTNDWPGFKLTSLVKMKSAAAWASGPVR